MAFPDLVIRGSTGDSETVEDATVRRYHVPPAWMPVPKTVLDLGANIGATAAHYREMWPDATVVAVEMDEGNAEVCRQNFDGQVIVAAVAAKSGIRNYWDDCGVASYSLGPGAGVTRAMTLWKLARSLPGGVCDFAKMDVEGAEWEILPQAGTGGPLDWAPLVRCLLIELHGWAIHDELVARATGLLTRGGYEVSRHLAHPASVYAQRGD